MNKNYDDYIVFLLGADEFAISQYVRENGERLGMDMMYNCCVQLAKKFNEFEQTYHLSTTPQYENFKMFLEEYFDEIVDFIYTRKDFEIKKGE